MLPNDKKKQIPPAKGEPVTHKLLLPIPKLQELKVLLGSDQEYVLKQFNVREIVRGIEKGDYIEAEFHYKDHYGFFELLVTDVHRARVPGRCDVVVKLVGLKNERKPSTLEKEAFLNPHRRRDYYLPEEILYNQKSPSCHSDARDRTSPRRPKKHRSPRFRLRAKHWRAIRAVRHPRYQ